MPAARKSAPKPTAVPDAEPVADADTPAPDGLKSIDVTDEELAMLTNARDLKKAVENPKTDESTGVPPGEAQVPVEQPQMVLLEDERAQREIDLRAINQQILTLRQSLAAGKLNRLLNERGWLQSGQGQHDKQFRQEIHEMREILDFLIALKASVGETGIEEPPLIALEIPDGPLVPA